MKDKFELNNNLSFSGRYKIQVVDAKTNNVVKEVEADNAICPWLSDILMSQMGVQTLATTNSYNYLNNIYHMFRYATLAKNDVGAGIDNNQLIGHNVAWSGSVAGNLASVDYQPIERIEGTDRTIGFTIQIGVNYCNNNPFDTIILSSYLENFSSNMIHKVNNESSSGIYVARYVPEHMLTFDINPVLESISLLCSMNDAILLKHIDNGITKYEIRSILDGSIIWDSSEYSLPAYSEYRRGNYYILLGNSSSGYMNKIIVINLINNEVKEYDYISSLYNKIYNNYSYIYPTKEDKYIRFSDHGYLIPSSFSINIYQGDFLTGEETLISTINYSKLYESFPESIKTTFLSAKNTRVFPFYEIYSGDDIGFIVSPNDSYNPKSGMYNQKVGYFLYDVYGNPIGQVPYQDGCAWISNSAVTPRYGWKRGSEARYSDISETCRRYWITITECPDIQCVSSIVSFPEISKTSQQILKITYELTQHNIGFPNRPTYNGFTPVS